MLIKVRGVFLVGALFDSKPGECRQVATTWQPPGRISHLLPIRAHSESHLAPCKSVVLRAQCNSLPVASDQRADGNTARRPGSPQHQIAHPYLERYDQKKHRYNALLAAASAAHADAVPGGPEEAQAVRIAIKTARQVGALEKEKERMAQQLGSSKDAAASSAGGADATAHPPCRHTQGGCWAC